MDQQRVGGPGIQLFVRQWLGQRQLRGTVDVEHAPIRAYAVETLLVLGRGQAAGPRPRCGWKGTPLPRRSRIGRVEAKEAAVELHTFCAGPGGLVHHCSKVHLVECVAQGIRTLRCSSKKAFTQETADGTERMRRATIGRQAVMLLCETQRKDRS